jgi:ribonuclease HIII
VKQYAKGKLHLQGSAGDLYREVLQAIVPQYNLRNPNAQISVDKLLATHRSAEPQSPRDAGASVPPPIDVPMPHIGTDESGKGDYFGPLVVAGVCLNSQLAERLLAAGVRDSKLLSDKKCRELANLIREVCVGYWHEVEILPDRYNDLYESFRKEGKNLNHLLAWGHARAIETLLERVDARHAIADQFGDERYIASRLMEKGRKLQLLQLPKGERYVAVAAASILSRDRFLTRLERLRVDYGVAIPKGAGGPVVQVGKEIVRLRGKSELRKVAKLHHKTTEAVLSA